MTEALLDIDSARDAVLQRSAPLPPQSVPIAGAIGRTLAEPVVSGERVPGFDNSAMDGYAIRADDLREASAERPVSLGLAGESRAGAAAEATVGAGEAIAISTGAMIPAGADAVVRVEDTDRRGGRVAVMAPAERGANLRRAGEDIEPGRTVVAEGTSAGTGRDRGAGVDRTGSGALPPRAERHLAQHRRRVDWRRGAPPRGQRPQLQRLRPAGARRRRGRRGGQNASASATTAGATVEAVGRGLDADLLVVSGGVSVGAARPRQGGLRRARGRAGLLGRLAEAGEAGLVRGRDRTASSSVCPATRSPPTSPSCSSCAPLCSRCRGPTRRAAAREAGSSMPVREARRSRPRGPLSPELAADRLAGDAGALPGLARDDLTGRRRRARADPGDGRTGRGRSAGDRRAAALSPGERAQRDRDCRRLD